MCVLDDVCAQIHGMSEGADAQFCTKLNAQVGKHDHYQPAAQGFLLHHYAGQVLTDTELLS